MMATSRKTIMLERDPSATHTKSDNGKNYNYSFLEAPLHVIWDDNTNLWRMQYNAPAKLPPSLQGLTFTTFSQLKNYVESYFKNRNIRIKEIIEVYET
jgi:hypothetical protein